MPTGAWAVGVSGGADSVALLTLLSQSRPDVCLHVVHLDHEYRGESSTADAGFVAALSARLGVPCTAARRGEVEPLLAGPPPKNREALGRACRLALFARVVRQHGLAGVLLAHHADDQAETVLMRLLRGGGERTLRGMSTVGRAGGVTVRRPLLGVRRARLRAWLEAIGQPFREDQTNESPVFARNRVRRALAGREDLADQLVALAAAMRGWCDWLDAAGPALAATFPATQLAALPRPLALNAALRWLTAVAGCPPAGCDEATLERLIDMAADAASPARQHFPGGVLVCRRAGTITAATRGPTPEPKRGPSPVLPPPPPPPPRHRGNAGAVRPPGRGRPRPSPDS